LQLKILYFAIDIPKFYFFKFLSFILGFVLFDVANVD